MGGRGLARRVYRAVSPRPCKCPIAWGVNVRQLLPTVLIMMVKRIKTYLVVAAKLCYAILRGNRRRVRTK